MHVTVLLKEAVESLHIEKNARVIDATLGAAGHSIEIIKKGASVLGIDTDPSMLEIAKANLNKAYPPQKRDKLVGSPFKLVSANFRNIADTARENGYDRVDAILFDLGVSQIHYKTTKRGFSFNEKDPPLDMRLDPVSQSVKASDLLNVLRLDQLFGLFKHYLSVPLARKLSRKIVSEREKKPFETVDDFLKVCEDLPKRTGVHPATSAFMALRIATNNEMENIKEGFSQAINLLKPKGRIVAITFHSSEDRVVKKIFENWVRSKRGFLVNKKPIVPGEAELSANKSARSAKLRVFEKA